MTRAVQQMVVVEHVSQGKGHIPCVNVKVTLSSAYAISGTLFLQTRTFLYNVLLSVYRISVLIVAPNMMSPFSFAFSAFTWEVDTILKIAYYNVYLTSIVLTLIAT